MGVILFFVFILLPHLFFRNSLQDFKINHHLILMAVTLMFFIQFNSLQDLRG